MTTKDAKTQYERLVGRGRENENQIKDRINQTIVDAGYAKDYDYILINNDIGETTKEIRDIALGVFDTNKNIENMHILINLVKEIKEGNYV